MGGIFITIENILKKIDAQFVDGFWSAFVVSAAIALVAVILIKIIGKALQKMEGRGRFGSVNMGYTRRIVAAAIVVLALMLVFMQVRPLQSISRSLLASSGVLAVIIGFAAQQAMANVVGGFFISVFKPVALGDRVKLVEHGIEGFVEDISLRHTVIRTFENTRVIVPNSVMNAAILENAQFQDAKVCRFVDIAIAPEADVDRAMAIIAREVSAHRDFYDNRTDEQRSAGAPAAAVRVTGLADGKVTLRATVWARDAGTAYDMVCDLLLAIKRRFDAEGVELANPQRAIMPGKPDKS